MPYEIDGWIEVSACPPEMRADFVESLWMPFMSIAPFGITGDSISDYLFSLSKFPSEDGLFRGRGFPEDCSSTTRTEIEQNRAFINEHGEGNFGHTYATLAEIEEALNRTDAPTNADSAWHHVLASIHFALRPYSRVLLHCRLVVWANW